MMMKNEIEKILEIIRKFNNEVVVWDKDYEDDHPEIGECLECIDEVTQELIKLRDKNEA